MFSNIPAHFKKMFLSIALTLFAATTHAQTVAPDEWVKIPVAGDQTFNNLTIPADAASKGMWSPVYSWPMNGLHAALLPDGKVLTFGSTLDGNAQNGRWYDVWNPALGFGSGAHTTNYDPSRQDSFCSAAVYLADGSLMVSGGNGSDTSTIYNTSSNSSFTANERMAEARWYPTLINLVDGRPIILGGMMPYTEQMVDQPDQAIANGWPSMTPEVFENGQWRSLFGAYSRLAFGPDYLRTSYPRAWVAPDGRIFGISADQMWYLDPDANGGLGEVTSAGVFKGPYSFNTPRNVGSTNSAVMFAPGRILQVGGNGGFNGDELPGSNMATLIDITSGAPVLTEQPTMKFARRYPNSVVLANSDVVITGGATYGNYYSGQPASPVYAAEIWNPVTGTWRVGATAVRYRGYHSITTLMTNGAILSTGGGTPGPVTNLNAEVYYPPYLFKQNGSTSVLATRPVMVAISGLAYDNGAAMQVDLASEEAITQLVLIGISSGTHSFNTGQRRIPLSFTQQQFRLTTSIPSNTAVPPGYYQVVAIGASGAPSYGTIVGIGQNQAEPPIVTTPYNPPVLDNTIATPVMFAGDSATYSVSPLAGTTYSWEVSDGTTTGYSAASQFTHTFSAAGLYTVTVSALGNNNVATHYTFVQAVSTISSAQASHQSSQMVFDSVANRLWVANPDNDTVTVINTLTKTKVAEIAVGNSPRSLALGPNNELWVTNKHSATVSIINRNTLSISQTITLPRASQPHGLVFNASGSQAYVALEAQGVLLAINAATKQTQGSLSLGQNIRHLAFDSAGNRVLVSRFITPPLAGESTAIVNTHSGGGEVLVVDAVTLTLTKTVRLQHSNKADTSITGSGIPNYLGAPAISPDGSLAWVPSKQDNITRGMLRNGTELDFQNSVRAISSAIKLGPLQEDYNLRVDHDNSGLGAAAVFHPNGIYVFVALETSREVAVLNGTNGNELFRVNVGIAPQSVVVSDDGLSLYVKNFIDRTVTVVDLTPLITKGQLLATTAATVKTVQNEALAANVLLGKSFFYDAKDTRLARDAYLSCASCHSDAGEDGRVWDFTGVGEGLRNTIELKGRGGMAHGLLHWTGNFDEVQDFEKQIRNFAGGTGLMADVDYFGTTVEAEAYTNTTLVDPFTASTVSGRTVMSWVSEGQILSTPTDTSAGQLHYKVVATGTSLTLFATVDLASAVDDSFYFKIQSVDSNWQTFNNQTTTGFEERNIATWTGLTVGQTYTLTILRREDGAKLDSFRVTGGQFGIAANKAGKSANLDALAAYLGSLQGTDPDKSFASSPNRNSDGTYTAPALVGEVIFANNCISCHGGNNFSKSSNEQAFENIGTLNAASGQRAGAALTALDVPTVRGVWATAPYLHNGSAATLAQAIIAHQSLSLTASELSEVTAYVQQIDGASVVPEIVPEIAQTKLLVEAEAYENTSLVAPFTASSSSGRTVMSWATTGQIFSAPSDTATGQLHYTVIATAKSLTLFAMVNLPSASDDSFYYKLQGVDSSWQTFNNQTTSGFQEREIFTWSGLTIGQSYTLKIMRREDGALLDSFRVLGGQFGVAVNLPPVNTPPTVKSAINDQNLLVGAPAVIIDLAPVFIDANGDALTYSASGSSSVAVQGSKLTVSTAKSENALVTVTANDGRGGLVSTAFAVNIEIPNRAPVVQKTIAAQTLNLGDPSIIINLNTIFADADGDTLSFSHTSTKVSDKNVTLVGSTLTMTSTELGTVTHTLIASDAEYSVQLQFTLTVSQNQSVNLFIEAETQTWLDATVDKNHTGFTGTGFANTANYINNWLAFTVTVPKAGTYSVTVRYANTGSNRPLKIDVNGVTQIASVDFTATGSWTTWTTKTFSVALSTGTNTVRLTSISALGAANIDSYRVQN